MFVICTLPNASDEINGVAFENHKEGKISVKAVTAEFAERFASIEGYKIVESKDGEKTAKKAEGKKAEAKGGEPNPETPAA